MNRPIKFRAWDAGNEIMIRENFYEFIMFDGTPIEVSANYGDVYRSPLSYVLLQFTGLIDNTGAEIYEGDILKLILVDYADVPEDQFVVSSDSFHADVCYLESIITHISDSDSECDSIEVIGNIYENPALLEE